MKIIVVSDSHGRVANLRRAVQQEPNAALLLFLGDGEDDLQRIRDIWGERPLLNVCGNCDWYSKAPETLLTEEGGKRIFMTHGHTLSVKFGDMKLRETARKKGADIALYGHTHQPVQQYDDGLYICNPGSVRQGDYAVLEIVPQGVLWTARKIEF